MTDKIDMLIQNPPRNLTQKHIQFLSTYIWEYGSGYLFKGHYQCNYGWYRYTWEDKEAPVYLGKTIIEAWDSLVSKYMDTQNTDR